MSRTLVATDTKIGKVVYNLVDDTTGEVLGVVCARALDVHFQKNPHNLLLTPEESFSCLMAVKKTLF